MLILGLGFQCDTFLDVDNWRQNGSVMEYRLHFDMARTELVLAYILNQKVHWCGLLGLRESTINLSKGMTSQMSYWLRACLLRWELWI